ncbi:hypothetical protein Fcan01_27754 [Folsomia candida]|uniref:Secreted protein n=1 Tax=Folsomia candida TaxID=158441 RepID=A0A226CVN9_FOLCA|nr:hypothetical protein Fcan01_27754 [Folsomia candida]
MTTLLSFVLIGIIGSQAVTMPYPAVTLGMGEMAACIGCIQRNNTYAVWEAEEQVHPRGSGAHVEAILDDPCRITHAIFTRTNQLIPLTKPQFKMLKTTVGLLLLALSGAPSTQQLPSLTLGFGELIQCAACLDRAILMRKWDCLSFIPKEKQTLLALMGGPEVAWVEWLVCPLGPGLQN